MMLNDSPTTNNVVTRIIEKLTGEKDATEETQSAAMVAGIVRQHGGGLTEEEIQALKEDAHKLTQIGTRLTA